MVRILLGMAIGLSLGLISGVARAQAAPAVESVDVDPSAAAATDSAVTSGLVSGAATAAEPAANGDAASNVTAQREAATAAPPAHDTLSRRDTLLAAITLFVLAIFLGFELINKVPPTLHTPLMSGSNAISGITLVGALIATGAKSQQVLVPILGVLAVIMATVNAVGGFAVTHRMLVMFRRK